MYWLGLGLSLLIGVSLGLLGGGGSILTVPVLVYVLGVPPRAAVALSLAVVGAAALSGLTLHARKGVVCWREGFLFAAAGVATAFVGARLTHRVSEDTLLTAFGALMIGVAVWMLIRERRDKARGESEEIPKEPSRWKAVAAGLAVGFLTGFLGVGGGFLIVPALLLFTGLAMREAVGTSLLVIAVNCAAGLVAHLEGGAVQEYGELLLAVSGLALAGTFAGTALAHRWPADRLRAAFAVFVLVVGLGVVLS
jgi:uncharacterized protein